MKRKRKGVPAAAWFYSQPGFHELPASTRHGDYGHVCNALCECFKPITVFVDGGAMSDGQPSDGGREYQDDSRDDDSCGYCGTNPATCECQAEERDSRQGKCGPELDPQSLEAQQAPDGSGHLLPVQSQEAYWYWRNRAERAEGALKVARDLLVAAGFADSEVVRVVGSVIAKAEGR